MVTGWSQGEALSREVGAHAYFETSARKLLGIRAPFEEAARLALDYRQKHGNAPKPKSVDGHTGGTNSTAEDGNKCCTLL
jgi:hypothetical protein